MSDALIQAVGWALVHSVWQGVAVAGALSLALQLVPRNAARVRYGLACAALVLMTALPAVTSIRGMPEPIVVEEVSVSSAPLTAPVKTPTGAHSPVLERVASTGGFEELLAPVARSVEANVQWFVFAWALGVLLASGRVFAGWRHVVRLTRTAEPAGRDWQAAVERLRAKLGISAAVRLLASARVEVPSTVGWLRPVVLVPVAALAGLSTQHLELILAHELAHIRRHDYLVNLLQTAAETLLFFHPAVWWIGGVIRAERENCCDDIAAASGPSAVTYARALTSLEALRSMPSPALSALGGSLPQRVRRLVAPTARCVSEWSPGASALTLVASVLLTVPVAAAAFTARAREEARTEEPAMVSIAPVEASASVASPSRPAEARVSGTRTRGAAAPAPGIAASVSPPARVAGAPAAPASTSAAPTTPSRGIAAPASAPAAPVSTIAAPTTPSLVIEAPTSATQVSASAAPASNITELPAAPASATRNAAPAAPAPGITGPVTPSRVPPAVGPAPAVAPWAGSQLAGPTPPAIAPAPIAGSRVAALQVAPPPPPAPPAAPGAWTDDDGFELAAAPSFDDDDEDSDERDEDEDRHDRKQLSRHDDDPDDDDRRDREERSPDDEDDELDARTVVGRDTLSVDQLVALRNAGVDSARVREVRSLGVEPTVENLVSLGHAGVTPEYARAMRERFGSRLDVDTLAGMKHVGVTVDYVRSLESAGYRDLDPDDVMGARAVGVTESYVRAMKDGGVAPRDLEELTGLRAVGVDARYLSELGELNLGRLDVDEVQSLRALGVTAAWVRELQAEGLTGLDVDDLQSLRAQGITAQYVRKMKAMGLKRLSVERLVELKATGITPEYLEGLKGL